MRRRARGVTVDPSAGLKVRPHLRQRFYPPQTDRPIVGLDVQLPGLATRPDELAKTDRQIDYFSQALNIPTRSSVKAGALEFLTKPFNGETYWCDPARNRRNSGRRSREKHFELFWRHVGMSPALKTVLIQFDVVAHRSTVCSARPAGERTACATSLNVVPVPISLRQAQLRGDSRGVGKRVVRP